MSIRKIASILAGTAAALSVSAAGAAGVFTVSPSGIGFTSTLDPFDSDYIAGNYSEVVTLTGATATTGTFSYSLLWRATEFDLAGNPVDDLVNGTSKSTGLNDNYVLYATLKGTGSYSASGTTVTFSPTLGATLTLNAKAGASLGAITAPTDGTGNYTFTNANPDKPLITGSTIQAEGTLKACSGTDCGSFGTITTAALVSPNGDNYFTGPRPFFDLTFEAGNFNAYWLTGGLPAAGGVFTTSLGGGAQVTFDYVPEPSALALVGLALVAAGVAGRRRGV